MYSLFYIFFRKEPSPSNIRRSFGKPNFNAPNVSPSSGAAFSREAAGRFSLRNFGQPPTNTLTSRTTKASSNAPVAPSAAKTAELNMWLRRKEYNPMRAAQMAKAKRNVRDEPAYLSKLV